MIFLDTDVAIAFRDGHAPTRDRVAALGELPFLSMLTQIELESGVHRGAAADAGLRRQLLARLLRTFAVEPLTEDDVRVYGATVAHRGYDRRLTLDRLVAAQAITRDALPITRNGRDFGRIEGLRLDAWPPL